MLSPGSPHRHFVRHIVISVVAVFAVTAILIAGTLMLASRRADTLALQRQQALMELVMRQLPERMARDQESVTLWDDSVVQLARPVLDQAWLDNNLGSWLARYYGFDEIHLLGPAGQPLYAYNDGRRRDPAAYRPLAPVADPLVRRVRAQLEADPAWASREKLASPSAHDFAVVRGHPAMVSVKPFLSETGKIAQSADRVSFHVAIQYLDGSRLDALGREYMFQGLRFAWPADARGSVAKQPLIANDGRTIGYLTWARFAPGSSVVGSILPALAGALLLVGAIIVLLILRIRNSTLRLMVSEARAQHLAFHDTLTGLPNRALFHDSLEQELARAKRGRGTFALLYLDLDRFKTVNDSFGHPVGDELIRAVANRLRAAVGESHTVARLGGDEFAVIQTGIRSPAEVDALCTRIVDAVSRPFDVQGLQLHVGISIGIAEGGRDFDHIEIIRRADIALYEAKSNERGRFVRFTPAMDSGVQRRKTVERDLRLALAGGEGLHVFYQPLVQARTGQLAGVEALARWTHPEHGAIPPATFIPIAEEAGLIDELGLRVLREACICAVIHDLPSVSVNVSPVQLRGRGFADDVMRVLKEVKLEPHRLELEITETCLIARADQHLANVNRLRKCGVRFALDDFGTGYSSLSHLRHFNVGRVKIDRSFVASIEMGSEDNAIVRAIVDLAHAAGLKVTAEGVETQAQRNFLTAIGCNELQGFLLGPPMAEEGLGAYLTETVAA